MSYQHADGSIEILSPQETIYAIGSNGEQNIRVNV